jgi:hypothetical protein
MTEPYSKDDILAALEALRTDGLSSWSAIAPEVFAAPIGDAWSPADNVRHLIKSTRPVVTALRLPRLPLKLLFGGARRPSRTYSVVVADYQEILRNGATAGRYAPSAAARPDDAAAWQADLVESCRTSVGELVSATAGWNDADLDAYRLPHPLLGKLTVRELLFFTLYHFEHHAKTVAKRRGALEPDGGDVLSASAT